MERTAAAEKTPYTAHDAYCTAFWVPAGPCRSRLDVTTLMAAPRRAISAAVLSAHSRCRPCLAGCTHSFECKLSCQWPHVIPLHASVCVFCLCWICHHVDVWIFVCIHSFYTQRRNLKFQPKTSVLTPFCVIFLKWTLVLRIIVFKRVLLCFKLVMHKKSVR